ncbi:hypothetical protein [Trinickia diaoshuihuensis]|uniref:hypothetical protein n=1 Tax=Trinickia diaoshuihuensis TaxID=2292265 RepID=UPI003B833E17
MSAAYRVRHGRFGAACRAPRARALFVAALAGLSLQCAWGQQATLPAAALVEQSDDAAASIATEASDAAAGIAQQSADAAAFAVPQFPRRLAPNPEFARFPAYAGMLGARRIVLRLGRKPGDPTGVHGEYQFADTGQVVLVAGDWDGDVLEIEDSGDGSSIAGNWVGRFMSDGSLAGDRMNADDSNPQPFVLHPLAGSLSTR